MVTTSQRAWVGGSIGLEQHANVLERFVCWLAGNGRNLVGKSLRNVFDGRNGNSGHDDGFGGLGVPWKTISLLY